MIQLSKPRVVIVGAGFGGLNAAKSLFNARVDVVLIDKNNHHLFQPLLYQVATSALSPGDIAIPVRTIMRGYENTQVIMNEVTGIEPGAKKIRLIDGDLNYDYLILAPGTRHSYFGKPEWEKHAPGLKNLEDALQIREKVLLSFEKAERVYGTAEAEELLTFVIVGGGPTGVELAGAIAEIGRRTMLPDFPLLNINDIKVYLIEGSDRLLQGYSQDLSEYTKSTLEKMGVNVLLSTKVVDANDQGVETKNGFINSANILWAAGNQASELLRDLNAELDKSGRVYVSKDLSVPGYPNIFVIGDAAHLKDKSGNIIPGIAPAAIQEAKFVAEIIRDRVPAEKRPDFQYWDKGSMATIGRAKAIAKFGNLGVKGFIAWFLWCFIHIFFLINFRNRFRVMIEWIWYYITNKPGARLIVYSDEEKKQKIYHS